MTLNAIITNIVNSYRIDMPDVASPPAMEVDQHAKLEDSPSAPIEEDRKPELEQPPVKSVSGSRFVLTARKLTDGPVDVEQTSENC